MDFSNVTGLETIQHSGPSTVGADTLQRSQGKIPESFLRGCGFSDMQIEMAKLHKPDLTSEEVTTVTYKIHELLVKNPIQYYSCFISYSNRDEEFARQLHDDLQNNGVRCWFAPEDMKIGDKIRPTIDSSIRFYDKLLVILSQYSIPSDWVETEVEKAFAKERRRKQTVLFPIRLDDAVMYTDTAWVSDIRETRHVGNFSNWPNRDAYQLSLKRLLRDLQIGQETPPNLPPRFTTLDSTYESLRRQLARHYANLNKLREDAAIYGAGELPLRLHNQIEAEQQAITKLETELRAIEMEQRQ